MSDGWIKGSGKDGQRGHERSKLHDPLSSALEGTDPLSQMAAEADPLSQMAAEMSLSQSVRNYGYTNVFLMRGTRRPFFGLANSSMKTLMFEDTWVEVHLLWFRNLRDFTELVSWFGG